MRLGLQRPWPVRGLLWMLSHCSDAPLDASLPVCYNDCLFFSFSQNVQNSLIKNPKDNTVITKMTLILQNSWINVWVKHILHFFLYFFKMTIFKLNLLIHNFTCVLCMLVIFFYFYFLIHLHPDRGLTPSSPSSPALTSPSPHYLPLLWGEGKAPPTQESTPSRTKQILSLWSPTRYDKGIQWQATELETAPTPIARGPSCTSVPNI